MSGSPDDARDTVQPGPDALDYLDDPDHPGIPELLAGRYQILERIGEGGMGIVCRGFDLDLEETIAVKFLRADLAEDDTLRTRFRREVKLARRVTHPNVARVFEFGRDGPLCFLTMEFVPGESLQVLLARAAILPPPEVRALAVNLCEALAAAHDAGVVHRDVKPGNLLVRPNGTLVLTDFGIARSEMAAQLTAAGSVLGTASYISPEQAAGATASPASDIYALGVVAYQCLSGRRPFDGDNPLEIAMKHVRDQPRPLPGDIPPQVRMIVERALAKDPASRWPSASALAAVARQAAAAAAERLAKEAARLQGELAKAEANRVDPASAVESWAEAQAPAIAAFRRALDRQGV